MARAVLRLLTAASLLANYTQAESSAEGSEVALAQASAESQRDFVKAISRLKSALQERRIAQAELEKRKSTSERRDVEQPSPTSPQHSNSSRGRVAAIATATQGVVLQQVAEKVELLGATQPRPHGRPHAASKAGAEKTTPTVSGAKDKASEVASDEESAAANPEREQGRGDHPTMPSAEVLLEEAEPNLEKCKIQGQKEPHETLATLKACTDELKKMATVTMEAHKGSENANKQYVSKFKEVMTLLKKLEAVHELQTAFEKDHENVRKYLVGEANKLKKPIKELGAGAEALPS